MMLNEIISSLRKQDLLFLASETRDEPALDTVSGGCLYHLD